MKRTAKIILWRQFDAAKRHYSFDGKDVATNYSDAIQRPDRMTKEVDV
jgi:hypothetical protein